MPTKIDEAYVEITTRDEKLRKGLKQVETRMVRLGRVAQTAGLKMKVAFTSAMAALGPLKIALLAITGGGIIAAIKRQADELDRLGKTAAKLGMTTEALAGMQLAAELTGVEVRTMSMALQRMTRRVAEAAAGTGEAKAALKELKLDAKSLKEMSIDRAFKEIARAMEGAGTQADRVRLSFKLFDSEGVDLVRTLGLGAKGLDEVMAKAKLLGLALSKEEIKKVEDYKDAMAELKGAFAGLARELATKLAPVLKDIADRLKEIFVERRAGGGMAGAPRVKSRMERLINERAAMVARVRALEADYNRPRTGWERFVGIDQDARAEQLRQIRNKRASIASYDRSIAAEGAKQDAAQRALPQRRAGARQLPQAAGGFVGDLAAEIVGKSPILGGMLGMIGGVPAGAGALAQAALGIDPVKRAAVQAGNQLTREQKRAAAAGGGAPGGQVMGLAGYQRSIQAAIDRKEKKREEMDEERNVRLQLIIDAVDKVGKKLPPGFVEGTL